VTTRDVKLTTFDKLYLGLTIPVVACGAIYLFPGVLQWPHLGLIVTLQIAILAAATLIHAARVLSWPSALLLGGLAFAVAWLAESSPVRSAIFGSDYDYAALLGPQLPGGVPLTVPLMWFGMCYLAWLYSSPLGAGTWRSAILRTILCGYLLCAFDLLLDPIATASGAFIWRSPGLYYGTPLQNFAGWFGVGAMLPPATGRHRRISADRWPPRHRGVSLADRTGGALGPAGRRGLVRDRVCPSRRDLGCSRTKGDSIQIARGRWRIQHRPPLPTAACGRAAGRSREAVSGRPERFQG
jgi:uncharacterized membrane protein